MCIVFSQSLVDKRKGGQLIANRANFAPSAQAVSESSEICVIREEKGQFQKSPPDTNKANYANSAQFAFGYFVKQNFTPIAPFYLQLLLSYISKENKVL